MNNEQRGSITISVITVLLLVVIALLIYLMTSNNASHNGRTIGTESPTHQSIPPSKPRPQTAATFDDGLGHAVSSTEYSLDDFGAGLARTDMFRYDINNDGRDDRITRNLRENGTAHFTYEYKIELNTVNGYKDITPKGFSTIEGAQCALQKLLFIFNPYFKVIKISRPWQDTWITPTVAKRETFEIVDNTLQQTESRTLTSVCDVSELF